MTSNIGKRPTGATSTVNKIVSQDIKIFLHHISRAFLVESYKGWSHIKLLAQWLFSMYKKSKNQLKIKKIKVGKMFPIKSLHFWPIYIFKRPCGLGAPGIFVFCSKLHVGCLSYAFHWAAACLLLFSPVKFWRVAIETRLNHRWRETKTQHTQAFSDDCCEDALPISSIIDGARGTKGSSLRWSW